MTKILTAFGLFLSGIFMTQTVFSAPLPSYPFVKNIILPSLTQQQPMVVRLDDEIIQSANKEVNNIQIVDTNNNTIPYQLYLEDAGILKDLEVLSVSSHHSGEESFLVDNDALTSYQFDLNEGTQENPSKIVLDLQKLRRLTRINIFDSAGPRIREVMIRGGATQKNIRTLVSKRAYKYQFDFSATNIQYLEIYLWGYGLVVDDIRVYQYIDAHVVFEAQPGVKYQILYGDAQNTDITFQSRIATLPQSALLGRLSAQDWNKMYPEDVDGDGIFNPVDNCFLISNPDQKDTDGDGIGNVCDNAPKVRNKNQEDVDFDGIGDIIDNCKLVPNPDQKDADKDGLGDACDDLLDDAAPGFFQKLLDPFRLAIVGLLILVLFGVWRIVQIHTKRVQ